MSFFTKNLNTYATVWKVFRREEKYIDLSATTSEKDRDGSYVNSRWTLRLVGNAFQRLQDVREGDRITVQSAKFTSPRIKQEDGTYRSFLNVTVFEAEPQERSSHPTPRVPENTDPFSEDAPW